MAKDFVSMILQALKEVTGIKLPEADQQAAKDALGKLPLTTADNVLQEGQIAVWKKAWEARGEDLADFKEKFREARDELASLKDTIKSGDSTSVKLIEDLKTRIKQLEPLNVKLLAAAASRWKGLEGSIPDETKKAFTFPKEAEEGKKPIPLTPEQVVANLDKYDEYAGLGFPGFGTTKDAKSGKPAVGAAKTTTGKEKGKQPDWRDKTPNEKVAVGYKTVTQLNPDQAAKTED
jgi:hypothetical protein